MTIVNPPNSTADTPGSDPEFVIITGMSGAGRETTARVFEDAGWYVVDNLPAPLLKDMVALEGAERRVAAVIDVRSRSYFPMLLSSIEDFAKQGIKITLLFLEATDDVLVQRFEQVRRPHPLSTDGSTLDWIRRERAELGPVRDAADTIVDTSKMNVHQLSTYIRGAIATRGDVRLRVRVMSFGFKYGIPLDADHVVDMRFLPNPYWNAALRPLTGLSPEVSGYVLGQPNAEPFLEKYLAALEEVFAGYAQENKSFVTIGVGCTGGKHRSVAMTEHLATLLSERGYRTTVGHRDMGRE